MPSMDGGSNAANTISFQMQSVTGGYPAVADAAFNAAVQASKAGGDSTAAFFTHLTETSSFWSSLAAGSVTFAPGVDPQGNAVLMASDGNTDLRLMSALSMPADPSSPDPLIGTATVQTGNTTTSLSMVMAFTARVASMPVYLRLSAALLNDLGKPLLANVKTLVQRMSSTLADQTRVEDPQVDALETSDQVLEEQSGEVQDLSEAGEEGLQYMAVDWSGVGLEVAGMAPLMAIPMVLEYLGHQMYHALIVQNLTSVDFSWSVDQVHGAAAVQPGGANPVIPGTMTAGGVPGVQDGTTLAFQANWQFINSTDLGAIGYVLTLTPADGGAPVQAVVSIPWAGENVIWAGTSTLDPGSLYDQQTATPTGALSVTAPFGAYQLTLSLNALSGKTVDGNYFYCSTAVLEPA